MSAGTIRVWCWLAVWFLSYWWDWWCVSRHPGWMCVSDHHTPEASDDLRVSGLTHRSSFGLETIWVEVLGLPLVLRSVENISEILQFIRDDFIQEFLEFCHTEQRLWVRPGVFSLKWVLPSFPWLIISETSNFFHLSLFSSLYLSVFIPHTNWGKCSVSPSTLSPSLHTYISLFPSFYSKAWHQ